ncbi:multicopper oxidase domain-containing protein [Bradyrhizobium erythrophlei]|uniref:multicopper oxidase domain-containing protein n=1 Tax=Bradyrhizobium erythrophlei TaxID=1437360 RepID=UPI0035F0BF5A
MSSKHIARERSISRWFAATALIAVALTGVGSAAADALLEPPVFASRDGVLDIMMVAMPQPIAGIAFRPPNSSTTIHPTGWVYQVCPRPPSGLSCPPDSRTVSPYGGVRLAMQPGDMLKVRYVNRLPKLDPLKLRHQTDPGEANLFLNPTNLHTHGLITPARSATRSDPTFGDFVFVTIFNQANGIPAPQSTHQHRPIVMDSVDYKITIPANHPSGLYWFHPHVHGIALNQLAQGLSGIITIGGVGNHVRGDAVGTPWPDTHVRHLMLKEIQVLAGRTINFDSGPQPVVNGEVLNQEDTTFCTQLPASGEVRQGSCPGQDNTASGGNNYTGGNWYMTVNGQQFPTVPITAPDGEIWRVATGAGSLSWDLQLVNDATNNPMTVQLIAIDGVAVHLPQDTTPGAMVQMAGGRFRVVPCPDVTQIGATVPVCVNEIVMMPSSRTEFWVTYRNAAGKITPPPHGASATLKMVGLTMGTGDAWPAVDLAKVLFNQSGPRLFTSNRVVVGGNTDAFGLHAQGGIFTSEVPGAGALAAVTTAAESAASAASCAPLPRGHRRRIFFGFSDVSVNNTFALGYEEVDERGRVVPGTQKPGPNQLERFDPAHTTVCLPLGPGQTPVKETWELVQLSTENHNFHIHQTRFTMTGGNGGVLQDNFPLGVAAPDATIANLVSSNQNGVCTISQWRSGHCASPAKVFDIPFAELGEFVYHCHILEHEDGGMMARIRVVPALH